MFGRLVLPCGRVYSPAFILVPWQVVRSSHRVPCDDAPGCLGTRCTEENVRILLDAGMGKVIVTGGASQSPC